MKKMQGGTNVNQRDIVFIPFPFTDLSGHKKRPVLILSGKQYNASNQDMICCALTCRKKNFYRGIRINNSDLDFGFLNYESAVIPCKIFTPKQNIVIRRLGRLNIKKSEEVVKFLNLNIEIEK